MIDFGFDKIALIGAVALIVIGPEKLPRVARTVGTLLGKARRYVADVKAEVNRSIELEELQKMKSQFESAARDVETSVQSELSAANAAFGDVTRDLTSGIDGADGIAFDDGSSSGAPLAAPVPQYKRPDKNWRLKRSALPHWYKQRSGVRTHAQSGAARVARFRPPALKK
ncbi:Sec-independent protein translocase subunit TatB [Aquincola sp. S2]|uniref:Sec-independent protein translocase protein TatB n=1 Tax=Pseudaquabacterium terrae TaxID=2732868 RepID=A0ABX2EKI9_9BURK|nr:Sec-independent protein translocase protein TatB [Aquabacterium terrae]NRF69113.1 Sec-independent protein translocase subunit TatB [Aquabacterium terrae]